jgi:hypothetical protein
MVTKLYDPTRVAVENEDHSTPDLGGWHCHIDIPELGFNAETIEPDSIPHPARPWTKLNVNSLET